LVDDAWSWQSVETKVPGRVSPAAFKFLDALKNATVGSTAKRMFNCPTASMDEWRAECVRLKLIDQDAKPHSARTLFAKYRLELISANRVVCNDNFAWVLA
jgi:hypothetical protein